MVYTIKNQCEEDRLVSYEDGARKIFLYTKGTEGNPSQALRDMLKYIEDTKSENVTNEDISKIHEFVEKAKHRKEVGIGYMNLWEEKVRMAKEARATGYVEGREEGFAEGREEGFATGHEEGKAEGKAEMYEVFIKMCQEFQISREDTCLRLQEKTGLPKEEAEGYIEKFW